MLRMFRDWRGARLERIERMLHLIGYVVGVAYVALPVALFVAAVIVSRDGEGL